MTIETHSRTALLVIGSLVGLLVAVAIVLALQPPRVFDPATPEGTAQGYYQAIVAGDEDRAATYMTRELREACEGNFWFYREGEDARIVITDSKIIGDDAELEITIEVSRGEGPFGGGSYDQAATLTMERHGDRWLIAEPTWPMDMYRCNRGRG